MHIIVSIVYQNLPCKIYNYNCTYQQSLHENSPSQNLHSLYEITFQYEYNCKYFSAKFFLAKFAVNLYEFVGIVQQNLHVNGYSSLRNRF